MIESVIGSCDCAYILATLVHLRFFELFEAGEE